MSVTSHALDPLPLSQTVTPSRTPCPLERDVLYGRPLYCLCAVDFILMQWLFLSQRIWLLSASVLAPGAELESAVSRWSAKMIQGEVVLSAGRLDV